MRVGVGWRCQAAGRGASLAWTRAGRAPERLGVGAMRSPADRVQSDGVDVGCELVAPAHMGVEACGVIRRCHRRPAARPMFRSA